jgi:hypothetical protein
MRFLLITALVGAVIYVTDQGLVTANKAALYGGAQKSTNVVRFKHKDNRTDKKPGITGPLRMMLRGAGYNH